MISVSPECMEGSWEPSEDTCPIQALLTSATHPHEPSLFAHGLDHLLDF